MSNSWFRFYSHSLNNPKVQLLSGDVFKAWVNILCVTSQCDGRVTNSDELCFHLRMSHEMLQPLLDELIENDLLVKQDGGYIPNAWDERQYKSDSSADRTRKYRERKAKLKGNEKQPCDNSRDVTVTPPDTDTDTDTELKKINKKNDEIELENLFEKFWSAGMAKTKKTDAKKKFISLVKPKSNRDEFVNMLVSDIGKRLAVGQLGFDAMHPTTYLNGSRWEDQIVKPNNFQQAANSDALPQRRNAVELVRNQVTYGPEPE